MIATCADEMCCMPAVERGLCYRHHEAWLNAGGFGDESVACGSVVASRWLILRRSEEPPTVYAASCVSCGREVKDRSARELRSATCECQS